MSSAKKDSKKPAQNANDKSKSEKSLVQEKPPGTQNKAVDNAQKQKEKEKQPQKKDSKPAQSKPAQPKQPQSKKQVQSTKKLEQVPPQKQKQKDQRSEQVLQPPQFQQTKTSKQTLQKSPTKADTQKSKHTEDFQQEDDVLKLSGILDAYQQFLKTLCKYGLPTGDIYEFAAQQIQKFQRKKRAKQLKLKAQMQIQKAARKKQQLQKQKQLKKPTKLASS